MQQTQDFRLRLPEVSEIVGLRRTAIYKGAKAGSFPPPVRVGARAVRWKLSEVQSWIEQRQRAGSDR